MFSATRLIAAIAIVALGTGTLFFAASPVPSPTVSPSPPAPTWTPPPGLVTGQLAPGVLLATDDGAGHSLTIAPDGSDFTFAPDGTIWLLHGSDLIRVGDESAYPAPVGGRYIADLTAASDGALWGLAAGTVTSFRGGAWESAPAFPGGVATALEVQADGTVWARSATTLGRLDGDAWAMFTIEDDRGPIPDYEHRVPSGLVLTSDGGLWVAKACWSLRIGLLRFDGSTFEPAARPPITGESCLTPMVSGPDGELWAFVASDRPALARHDEAGWSVSAPDAGVPWITGLGAYHGNMVVAPDGRVWATGRGHPGPTTVGVYDGRTWTDAYAGGDAGSFEGHPIKVAPDGTIWLLTEDGFIVIDPEVAMADQ